MTIINIKNEIYQTVKSTLQRIHVNTITLIFFIAGVLLTVCFYESSTVEKGIARLLISIMALVFSFIAFYITRTDKALRDKYEISQIYFNEAKDVLKKSITHICEESNNEEPIHLVRNWQIQSNSLDAYTRLKNNIKHNAHIDSLAIHEINSRNEIISFLKTGTNGGKIESGQLLPISNSLDEFLKYIIPIYSFATAMDYKKKNLDIVKQIKSLPNESEFYVFRGALTTLEEGKD